MPESPWEGEIDFTGGLVAGGNGNRRGGGGG